MASRLTMLSFMASRHAMMMMMMIRIFPLLLPFYSGAVVKLPCANCIKTYEKLPPDQSLYTSGIDQCLGEGTFVGQD